MAFDDTRAVEEQIQEAVDSPFAFPGGYTKVAIMGDGELMCIGCLDENRELVIADTNNGPSSGWELAGINVYWDGPPVPCANCNCDMESEYGDPSKDGI